VFVTETAPLATNMYVQAVAADLSATATQVQLTLTTFFVGMALGRLVGGSVSDQRGRRIPLLAAIVAMTVASVVLRCHRQSPSWPGPVSFKALPAAGPW
jgi:DHA1 family bicyclomycin/chloramphenicol resistance-like MFS transporter